MTTTFYSLKVLEVCRETHDCVSVVLAIPDNLKNEFQYLPGQYLTFRRQLGGQELRRTYSISSAPGDQELRVAIKLLPGGAFSSWANEQLRPGDELDTMKPQGRFSLVPNPQASKRYLMIAAGSGITPIMSLMKTILREEPQSQIVLIFGNRSKGSIIFKARIEELKNRYLKRLSVYHVLSREKAEADFLHGRIDTAKLNYFLDNLVSLGSVDDIFMCGPEEMILGSRDLFLAKGFLVDKIHFELFFTSKNVPPKSTLQPSDNSPKSKIALKLDGVETVFYLGDSEESVLDAALRNGLDLPFACKGGVCATCRAKVEKGSVEMMVNYSLTSQELAAGFVLTCQARPTTSEVVVNFDIK